MKIKQSKKFISLYPMINNLIEMGYTHASINEKLKNEYDLDIKLSTFNKYLCRYKEFNKSLGSAKIQENIQTANYLDDDPLSILNTNKPVTDQSRVSENVPMTLAEKQGMAGDMSVVRRKAAALLMQAKTK